MPKGKSIEDFNKDLRPISLTSTLSKVAEGFVIEKDLKPVLLKCIEPNQYGFIPNSCTTFALISMLHHWLKATNGSGSHVRVALLDYKAFDLVDHNLLIAKLYSIGVKPTVVNWICDFLRNRSQRVKLDSSCFSDFVNVPAGIPQGTKIGPWLFLAMINDLSTTSAPWKFADDITLAEVIPKSSTSTLQNTVDGVLKWTDENVFRLNPTKCKEMQIDFRKKRGVSSSLESEGKQFEVVKSAKILGLTIRDDLKWNDHIDNVTVKASQRVYLLKQLKRADIDCISLLQFYCACIRSVLEYACQSFHSSLPAYLSDQLERIQKRSLIIYPDLSYSEALTKSSMSTFQDRRELLCRKLFMEIVDNKGHKLHQLLPPLNAITYKTRKSREFRVPHCKTKRFSSWFIMHYASQLLRS